MKILKGFVLAILGFILFVALSVFGLAFTVDSTVLSSKFVSREINRLPVVTLARQSIADQGLPAGISSGLDTAVTKIAPSLQQETGAAVTRVYDYLKGKKNSPELTKTLRATLLSDSFIDTVIDSTPIASIASNEILDLLQNMDIPPDVKPLENSIAPAFAAAEPDIKAQLKIIAPLVIDYLLGNTDNLNVTLNLKPVVADLMAAAKSRVMQSLPENVKNQSQAQIDAYVNQYIDQNYDQIFSNVPDTFSIDTTLITPDMRAQLTQQIANGEKSLQDVRPYIALFQRYYILLIVLIIVLIAGIAAIHYSVRGATRSLGSIFLTYGVVEFAGVLLAKYFLSTQVFPSLQTQQFGTGTMPPELVTFIQQFTFDFISPLWWFSLGCLIGGVVLLIVSFVYRPAKPVYSPPTG